MKKRHIGTGTPARAVERIVKEVEFTLNLPQARAVALAGTFNAWDPKRTPMRRRPTGVWETKVSLPPGRYEYRFVADGTWLSDPESKDSVRNDFGSTNSVRVIPE